MEEVNKALFEKSLEGVVVISHDQTIRQLNPQASRLLGYSEAELTGQHLEKITAPQCAITLEKLCENVFNGGDTGYAGKIESALLTKDGNQLPVEICAYDHMHSNLGAIAIVVFIDISKRKEAQREAYARQELLEKIIRHTPVAIAVFDMQMRYITVSNQFTQDYNLGNRNVVGICHYDVFPEIPERWKEIHRRCLAGETLGLEEDQFPRADGSLDWVRWQICPWYKTETEIGGIILISEVITRRKKMEEELKKSEARYRLMFEEINESFIVQEAVTDASGNIVDLRYVEINPQAEKSLGKTNEEIVGHTRSEVIGPMDVEAYDIARRVIIGNERVKMERHVPSTGEWFFINSYSPQPGKIATLNLDVTDLKTKELELKKLNAELEDKVKERTREVVEALEREKTINELKSRFVSMASHEFRTPLSALLSSTNLLEKYTHPLPDSKEAKHFNRIKSSVNHLTEILNDFLSLDKLESGQHVSSVQHLNLKELAQNVAEEMNDSIKKGQRIWLTYSGTEEINQDKKVLRNILYNLLSNAVKYSGEDKKIDLVISVKDEQLEIIVKDQGIGIPEHEQQHMFSRLFRAKNAINISGTGLGLNIVKRYLDLMSGTIRFESRHGEGTTFYVKIPLGESSVQE